MISNGGGVQLRKVKSVIQGNILTTFPPNAQEVPRRDQGVTPVRAEAIGSNWRGQWKQQLNMRLALRSTSTTKIENDRIGQNRRLTLTPPNRKITVRKKNRVRE